MTLDPMLTAHPRPVGPAASAARRAACPAVFDAGDATERRTDLDARMRRCAICETWKPFAAYTPDDRAYAGIRYECRPCAALIKRLRRDGVKRSPDAARAIRQADADRLAAD